MLGKLMACMVLVGLTGCVRGAGIKRDGGGLSEEAPSYYSRVPKGKGASRQLELMGQPKKRVVVLDFWNNTPVQEAEIGSFAAEELRKNLYMTQKVLITPEVRSEHSTEGFVHGDQVKVAQLVREGRKLGTSVLVIGRVAKIVYRQKGDEVGLLRESQAMAVTDVELKVFDISSGREVLNVGKSGQASATQMVAVTAESPHKPETRNELTQQALRQAMNSAIPDILKVVEKMQWTGSLAKVAGPKIYVNAGQASGLVPGDILKVMAPGDDVYDPVTGAFLGRSAGQMKGTLEVRGYVGTDGAVAEVHTGANFQEGDVVQLY